MVALLLAGEKEMIKTCNGFVLIKLLPEPEQRSKGGITLTTKGNTHIVVAEVVESHDEGYLPGDTVVVYRQMSAFTYNGQELFFVKAEDILGEITDDVAE